MDRGTLRGVRGVRGLLAAAVLGLTGAAVEAAPVTVTTTDELRQGSVNAVVTLHGTGLAAATAVDFGADVTVHGFTATGGGTRLAVTVSLADLAAAGDRAVTVTLPADTATGTIRVQWPADALIEAIRSGGTITDDREPSRNPGVVGVSVYAAQGEFFMSRTDVATRGRMMGLAWTRTYQSNNAGTPSPLGRGWTGYYYQRAVYVAGGARPGIRWLTPVVPPLIPAADRAEICRAIAASTADGVTRLWRHRWRSHACRPGSLGRTTRTTTAP